MQTGDLTLLQRPDTEKCRISPVTVKIAESVTRGEESAAIVLWGDYMKAGKFIPEGRRLAAIDIFGKDDREKTDQIVAGWKAAFGGDAFIP